MGSEALGLMDLEGSGYEMRCAHQNLICFALFLHKSCMK